MFKTHDFGYGGTSNPAALTIGQALPRERLGPVARAKSLINSLRETEWIVDLGEDIGSGRWFRGFATCAALCALTIAVAPGLRAIPGKTTPKLEGRALDEARTQSIMPLAFGGNTGRTMSASALAVPISNTPERATIDLNITLGQGDGFARVLERAGISGGEATRIADMVGRVAPLAEIPAGTTMAVVLGPRNSRDVPRPIQSLDLRARFDLKLEFRRVGGQLQMRQVPISVDNTPIRIQGGIGEGLYRSARAAGVPIGALESYIRVIAAKGLLETEATTGAQFDMIVEHARSANGEVRPGKLLYAGLFNNGKAWRLIPWTVDGQDGWFTEATVSQRRSGMVQPVANPRLTSSFGVRVHPVLGYTRFHRGVDYGAAYGTPVYAVTDGLVAFAGPHGGYGNHVRLSHSGNLGTSYSHLSTILVGPGTRVRQGQLVAYSGNSGISTGPHLHFEVYVNGVPVDPRGVSFASEPLLSGAQLSAFRAKLGELQSVPVSGAR